jgi:membrane-associated protease RseP (regulator of RpoE activity)
MDFFRRNSVALLALVVVATGAMAGEAAPATPAVPAVPVVPAVPASAAQAQSQAQTERALAEAQQRLEAAAREVGELSAQLGQHMGEQHMVFANAVPMRSQLGLQISNTPSKDGAHVMAVSPGGPAAEAGIRDGDVITSIGGQDLTKSGDPGRELVDHVRQLQPDLKVKVTVLRAGKKLDFDVAPRPMPQTFELRHMGPMTGAAPFPGPMPGPGGHVFNLQTPPPGGVAAISDGQNWVYTRGPDTGMGFRGMEFATLSEKLGSYFGVKSGVLVVRTGNNDAFKLQDGDVILSIDGREPGNAQHAGRILRSYRGGEKLTLRVQRDRKAQNIEVTLPGGADNDD